MADVKCPSCGAEVPEETGQHAQTPSAGLVTCPTCGADVTVPTPGGKPAGEDVPTEGGTASGYPAGEPTGEDRWAGQDDAAGVMEEIDEKEGG